MLIRTVVRPITTVAGYPTVDQPATMTQSEPPTPAVTTDRHETPVKLLRDLIRFDTTNLPGNERACIEWIAELLDAYGVAHETYAADPDRPVLVGRIDGGDAPPLLLYGHVDVVPAEGDWSYPPFKGTLKDGYVWGRGALDMKAGVTMFVAAFPQTASEAVEPAGDLLLCIVPDEETGGDDGLSQYWGILVLSGTSRYKTAPTVY